MRGIAGQLQGGRGVKPLIQNSLFDFGPFRPSTFDFLTFDF
jgi:hypothetical protein